MEWGYMDNKDKETDKNQKGGGESDTFWNQN